MYRGFLFKSKTDDQQVNESIGQLIEQAWPSHRMDGRICPFDIDKVKGQIVELLTDQCKIFVSLPSAENTQLGYMHIVTSDEKAGSILPYIRAIAEENSLVFYDCEMGKASSERLYDGALIAARRRGNELRDIIVKRIKPVWKFLPLFSHPDYSKWHFNYSVIISDDAESTLKERTLEFRKVIKQFLKRDEELFYRDKCFIVTSEQYELSFCLEAYRKNPEKVCYIENNQTFIKPLGRPGSEELLCNLKKLNKQEQAVHLSRMQFTEMIAEYPNPVERLSASFRITKWLEKNRLDIRYTTRGPYGSEVLFHIVPESEQEKDRISVLAIEEDTASFILPVIEEFYPYIYERYNLEQNHIPIQLWYSILNRLKEVRDLILKDPYCEELRPLVERFNVFVLPDEKVLDQEQVEIIKNNPLDCLRNYQYVAARIYDVFIDWSEKQLKYYDTGFGCGRMFNIQGP